MNYRTFILVFGVWCLVFDLFGQSVVPNRRRNFQPVAGGGGGGGSPAFVDQVNATPANPATTLTINQTVAAGATLVIGTGWEDADRTVTVSSDVDGSFTALTKTNWSGTIYGQHFYKIGLTAGAHVITISYGASTAFCKASSVELSGVTSFDVEAGPFAANDTAAYTYAASTANAVEALVCFTMNYDGATGTPQSGWTEDYDVSAFNTQHLITSSSGSYRGATTNSVAARFVIFMGAYK